MTGLVLSTRARQAAAGVGLLLAGVAAYGVWTARRADIRTLQAVVGVAPPQAVAPLARGYAVQAGGRVITQGEPEGSAIDVTTTLQGVPAAFRFYMPGGERWFTASLWLSGAAVVLFAVALYAPQAPVEAEVRAGGEAVLPPLRRTASAARRIEVDAAELQYLLRDGDISDTQDMIDDELIEEVIRGVGADAA